MNITSCLVGNSSSAIREGAFIGTPAVNIGNRQKGRQRAKNVIDSKNNINEIVSSIKKQIDRKKYKQSYIYGKGEAGKKISDILSIVKVKIQKKITY